MLHVIFTLRGWHRIHGFDASAPWVEMGLPGKDMNRVDLVQEQKVATRALANDHAIFVAGE
jgi:hypothetical protein